MKILEEIILTNYFHFGTSTMVLYEFYFVNFKCREHSITSLNF